jgi:hypothetical protein
MRLRAIIATRRIISFQGKMPSVWLLKSAKLSHAPTVGIIVGGRIIKRKQFENQTYCIQRLSS